MQRAAQVLPHGGQQLRARWRGVASRSAYVVVSAGWRSRARGPGLAAHGWVAWNTVAALALGWTAAATRRTADRANHPASPHQQTLGYRTTTSGARRALREPASAWPDPTTKCPKDKRECPKDKQKVSGRRPIEDLQYKTQAPNHHRLRSSILDHSDKHGHLWLMSHTIATQSLRLLPSSTPCIPMVSESSGRGT
jgi:hypothetical protein